MEDSVVHEFRSKIGEELFESLEQEMGYANSLVVLAHVLIHHAELLDALFGEVVRAPLGLLVALVEVAGSPNKASSSSAW